jgi:hypothetical protein
LARENRAENYYCVETVINGLKGCKLHTVGSGLNIPNSGTKMEEERNEYSKTA